MLEKQWKSLAGGPAVDLRLEVEREVANGATELCIGTDSQQVKRFTEYVTVVVTTRPGKGGRVIFHRERVPRIKSLRERLSREVWMSTSLAMELTAPFDIGSNPIDDLELSIHIDANPDPKYRSSEYVQELVGLVVGQGFHAVIKPQSWAAGHAADHCVKHKNDKYMNSGGGLR